MGKATPLKLLLFIIISLGCSKITYVDNYPDHHPFHHMDTTLNKHFKLVWNDEFSGDTLDSLKWSYRALGKRHKAINVTETVKLNGKGQLVISVFKKDSIFHAGMIGTMGKFEQKEGYFECLVKLNSVEGPHSAFWLQSRNISKGTDPYLFGAEVDIYEYMPALKSILYNVYWNYPEGPLGAGQAIPISHFPSLKSEYMKFAVLWYPDLYAFFMNDKFMGTIKQGMSGIPLYIILSMEITGYGGFGDYTKLVSDSVLFDYVRVYDFKNKESFVNILRSFNPQ